jgi:hypothetical protein
MADDGSREYTEYWTQAFVLLGQNDRFCSPKLIYGGKNPAFEAKRTQLEAFCITRLGLGSVNWIS